MARILLTPLQLLKNTDITEYAIREFSKFRPNNVIITGRRGPLDATFTIKEFRKIIAIPECNVKLNALDFDKLVNCKESLTGNDILPRSKQRIRELLEKTLKNSTNTLSSSNTNKSSVNTLEFKFYLKPLEIVPSTSNHGNVGGVKFLKLNPDTSSKDVSDATPSQEILIECGTVIKSIGFKGSDIDAEMPLVDPKSGIIPNHKGFIDKYEGLFCSGWIKTGSIGDISTTMNDAFETAQGVLNYLKGLNHQGKLGDEDILPLLKEYGIKYSTVKDWEQIDKLEIKMGAEKNKIREKLIDLPRQNDS